ALLEVLDPEQNHSFSDHYLDVPFDLSKVMFITTANTTFTIPSALLDRMEMIDLPGYTEIEKFKIAQQFLVPRQLEAHGLSKTQVTFSEDALRTVIRSYTREAGVRNLEREIAGICRKVAKDIAGGKRKSKRVNEKDLREYLGPIRFRFEVAEEEDEVGVVTGLAWTEAGGDVLFVEATVVPGTGNLILTGKLGDVMQESVKAALTFCRGKAEEYGIDAKFFSEHDLHVHVPAGAIPKDGPSAGVTMTTALLSAITGRKVRKDVGMTGEITLRGKVLPIGGLKEKVLAAHRAGIRTIIMPFDNEKDLEEIPEFIRKDMTFHPVKRIHEVLQLAILDGKGSVRVSKASSPRPKPAAVAARERKAKPTKSK
ncbi:MAG: S16 family serine protease, partial [Candidatus Geothermincolia bacterium]